MKGVWATNFICHLIFGGHLLNIPNVDTSINTGGGLLGTVVSMAATALSTAMTDKVVAGRKCNAFVLSDMPVGKYSPNYGKDQNLEAGKSYIKATVK